MIALKYVVTFAYPQGREEIIGRLRHYRLAKLIAFEKFRAHPSCQLRIRERWIYGLSTAYEEVYRHRGVDHFRRGNDDDDHNAEQLTGADHVEAEGNR